MYVIGYNLDGPNESTPKFVPVGDTHKAMLLVTSVSDGDVKPFPGTAYQDKEFLPALFSTKELAESRVAHLRTLNKDVSYFVVELPQLPSDGAYKWQRSTIEDALNALFNDKNVNEVYLNRIVDAINSLSLYETPFKRYERTKTFTVEVALTVNSEFEIEAKSESHVRGVLMNDSDYKAWFEDVRSASEAYPSVELVEVYENESDDD